MFFFWILVFFSGGFMINVFRIGEELAVYLLYTSFVISKIIEWSFFKIVLRVLNLCFITSIVYNSKFMNKTVEKIKLLFKTQDYKNWPSQ